MANKFRVGLSQQAWESMRTSEEIAQHEDREAHMGGYCQRAPACWYCTEEQEQDEEIKPECDCLDSHANLNLDWYTCGCPCHNEEKRNRRISEINQKAFEKLEPLRKALESLDVNQINRAFEQMTWKK